MSKRADTTTFLISDHVALRVDFADARRETAGQQVGEFVERLDGSPLQAIRILCDGLPSPGRTVVIFATEVWNLQVSLPRQSISGLNEHELATALKYEIESLAGIDADDCVLSAVEMATESGDRMFWVNAFYRSQWDSIIELLGKQGVRSIEMRHPTTAREATQPTNGDFGQLEVWGNSAALKSSHGELLGIYPWKNDPASWRSWLQTSTGEGNLTNTALLLDTSPGGDNASLSEFESVVILNSPETLAYWLQRRRLPSATEDATRPVLECHPEGYRKFRRWILQAALLLLLAAVCGWHYTWLNQVSRSLQQDINQVREPAMVKQRFDTQIQSALEKRTELMDAAGGSRRDLRQVQFLFGQQFDRMERLLVMLAKLRTSELVIREIAPDPRGLVVAGISIHGDTAPLMANRLRDLAAPMGWKIHPATQIGELKMTNGGPWKFRILLEDIGPDDASLLQDNVADDIKPEIVPVNYRPETPFYRRRGLRP